MDRVKFNTTYSDEIKMLSSKDRVSMVVALDRLWNAFSYVNFDVSIFDEVTLVKLLWSKS